MENPRYNKKIAIGLIILSLIMGIMGGLQKAYAGTSWTYATDNVTIIGSDHDVSYNLGTDFFDPGLYSTDLIVQDSNGDIITQQNFLDITMPKNATVISAILQMRSGAYSDPIVRYITIYGIDDDIIHGNITDKGEMGGTYSNNSTTAQINELSAGWHNYEVTGIIQEILDENQVGWTSGSSDIALITLGQRYSGQRVYNSFESGKPSRLYISYKVPHTIGGSTEEYKEHTIVTIAGSSDALTCYSYYRNADATEYLVTVDDNGNLLNNVSIGGYGTWMVQPEYTNWLTIGDSIYCINSTGDFVQSTDHGASWLKLGDLTNVTMHGGQGFTLDSVNEIIHGVFTEAGDNYYFNYTIGTSTLSTKQKIFEGGTNGGVRHISIDCDDENGNTGNLFVLMAKQQGASNNYGGALARRNATGWFTDLVGASSLVKSTDTAVRFIDGTPGVTLVIGNDDLSGNTDARANIYYLANSAELTTVPDNPETNWYQTPSAGGEDKGEWPRSVISESGRVNTIYLYQNASVTAGYWLPAISQVEYPYVAETIGELFNSTASQYRFSHMDITLFMTDPLDTSTYDIDYYGMSDKYAGGNKGHMYEWGLGFGSSTPATEYVSSVKKVGNIVGAIYNMQDAPDYSLGRGLNKEAFAVAVSATMIIYDPNGTIIYNGTILPDPNDWIDRFYQTDRFANIGGMFADLFVVIGLIIIMGSMYMGISSFQNGSFQTGIFFFAGGIPIGYALIIAGLGG